MLLLIVKCVHLKLMFNGIRDSVNDATGNKLVVKHESSDFDPRGPLVLCSFLPMQFLRCESLVKHGGNQTSFDENQIGCLDIEDGAVRYHDVKKGINVRDNLSLISRR